MNLTIFGATGTIGRLVVDQALTQGHDVTAFTRDAARVIAEHDRLQVVEGDVTDPAACLPAVKDADAVVVALGAGRKGQVREAGTRAVVAAMKQAGGRRLVCQSTLGVGSSRKTSTCCGSTSCLARCCDRHTPTTYSRSGWWRRATWTG